MNILFFFAGTNDLNDLKFSTDDYTENCSIIKIHAMIIEYSCPDIPSIKEDYKLILNTKSPICEIEIFSYNLALDATFTNSDGDIVTILNDLVNNSISDCIHIDTRSDSTIQIDFPVVYSIEIVYLYISKFSISKLLSIKKK